MRDVICQEMETCSEGFRYTPEDPANVREAPTETFGVVPKTVGACPDYSGSEAIRY